MEIASGPLLWSGLVERNYFLLTISPYINIELNNIRAIRIRAFLALTVVILKSFECLLFER